MTVETRLLRMWQFAAVVMRPINATWDTQFSKWAAATVPSPRRWTGCCQQDLLDRDTIVQAHPMAQQANVYHWADLIRISMRCHWYNTLTIQWSPLPLRCNVICPCSRYNASNNNLIAIFVSMWFCLIRINSLSHDSAWCKRIFKISYYLTSAFFLSSPFPCFLDFCCPNQYI